jgi:hypothetical protein
MSLGHEITNIYHSLCTVAPNGVGVSVTAFQNRYRCAECQLRTGFESTFVSSPTGLGLLLLIRNLSKNSTRHTFENTFPLYRKCNLIS